MRLAGICCTLLVLLLLFGCGDQNEVTVTQSQTEGKSTVSATPVTGDWLVLHALSDPEQLNPLTSSDAGSSEVLAYIFESLLTRDPRTLEFKPLIAEARPVISQDKL